MSLQHILVFFLIVFHNNISLSQSYEQNNYNIPKLNLDHETYKYSELMDWIEENDGYINENQEIRRTDPDRGNINSFGLFAKEDIDEDEILLFVPFEIIIEGDYCGSMEQLWNEVDLGDDSKMKPFVDFLASIYEMTAPKSWSYLGQNLLHRIIGLNLPPEEILLLNGDLSEKRKLIDICEFDDTEVSSRTFVNLSNLLSFEEIGFIPFADLYKHRNGKWKNVNAPLENLEGIVFTASRPIKAGEQLHLSYEVLDEKSYLTSELFYEFGIIEQTPQVWEIGNGLIFVIEEVKLSPCEYYLKWRTHPSFYDMLFLEKELNRLKSIFSLKDKGYVDFIERSESMRYIRHIHNEFLWDYIDFDYEWYTAWKYHNTLLTSIEKAFEASSQFLTSSLNRTVSDKVYIVSENEDDQDKLDSICTHHYARITDHVELVEKSSSAFQDLMVFKLNQNDLCFALNSQIHTCASFRPPMHEMYVHFPVAYLNSLKRVAFLGGGDSMVLHEILKYQSVTYVLGMELDQNVVRQSFKHFYSKPHFDDPKNRVHWIFGDATKTLQMLPKDYFRSFDLVIVDLPIEVMHLPVGDQLNLLEASSLLTTDDGVFIINDYFYSELSRLYDHTLELRFEGYPIHCQQYFVLGSNNVDFLSPNFNLMKENDVETLFYNPLQNISVHYDPFARIAKNNNGVTLDENQLINMKDKRRKIHDGIFTVLDIENNFVSKLDVMDVSSKVRNVIEDAGFNEIDFITKIFDEEKCIVIAILSEGYIIVRIFPRFVYTAVDVHLWDSLHLEETVKKALIRNLAERDGLTSTFSIVVGGLRVEGKNGISGSGEVKDLKCSNTDPFVRQDVDMSNISITLIEEGVELTSKEKSGFIVILCHRDTNETCNYLDGINRQIGKRLIIMYTSPLRKEKIDGNYETDKEDITRISLYKQTLKTVLGSLISEEKKIQFLFIDPTANPELVYSFEKIISQDELRKLYFDDDFVLMAGGYFLDEKGGERMFRRLRKKILNQSVSLSEIMVGNVEHEMIEVLKIGDSTAIDDIRQFVSKVEKRIEYDVSISVWMGNVYKFPVNKDEIYSYSLHDYDNSESITQLMKQNQLASQGLYKITLRDSDSYDTKVLQQNIIDTMRSAAEKSSLLLMKTVEIVEDAIIVVLLMGDGQIVATWDGSTNIDLNIFLHDNGHVDMLYRIIQSMLIPEKGQLYGSQPRGTGKIVTYMP